MQISERATCYWILVFVFGCTQLMADLEILDTQAGTDYSVRIVFQDTDPPEPYVLYKFDELNPASPWKQVPWHQLQCIEPAIFEMSIPGAVQDPGFYKIGIGVGTGQPLIIASDPANGATGISPDLEKVSFTFDRPMSGQVSVEASNNWGSSFVVWSADRTTLEIFRLSGVSSLSGLSKVRIILNPDGYGTSDSMGMELPTYSLEFTTDSVEVEGPHIVTSNPAPGDEGVDPNIETVEFHFSERMMEGSGGFINSGWYPWTMTWSPDGKTAYVSRDTEGPLYSATVKLQSFSFVAYDGEQMTTDYSVQFTTADPPRLRMVADPAKGFYWPYYLVIPDVITQPGTLLVEPNNTGTWGDDPWFHEDAAIALLNWRTSFATALGSPLLVPVFPRPVNPPAPEPGGLYIQAMDRYSLYDDWPGLERIDLQMLAMIDDALGRLRDMGLNMGNKVFMMGFSASGAFTSRFSILHPDRLKAAACGSPGGWPIVPVSSWQDTQLPYPFGIADLPQLSGESVDVNAFKQVPLYIYVGGFDTNDALDWRELSTAEANAIKGLLNYPGDPVLAHRWPLAESIYDSIGANATFVVYPGIQHTITTEMFEDLKNFFTSHR